MLLDINVCLALVWERHQFHEIARDWFDSRLKAGDELFVCRISQMGLLRLLTDGRVLGPEAVTQSEAWEMYYQFLSIHGVGFMNEPETVEHSFFLFSKRDEPSPKRWTDDYLLAFAEAANISLTTLDKALSRRSPSAVLVA